MLDRKKSVKGEREGRVFGFQGAQADVRLELRLPEQRTIAQVDYVSCVRPSRGGVEGVFLAVQGAEVGNNVVIEVELACGAKDHAFISCSSKVPNNLLDCNGM